MSDQMTEAPALAELDAAIAAEVMGWERRVTGRDVVGWITPDGGWRSKPEWRPSTDIAAAFDVVERMLAAGRTEVILRSPNSRNPRGWRVSIWAPARPHGINEPTAAARHDSLPRAICEAALQAARSGQQSSLTRAEMNDSSPEEDSADADAT